MAAVSGLVRADADGCLVCHAASLPCDVRWKKHIWLLFLLRVGRGRVHLPVNCLPVPVKTLPWIR